MYSTKLIYELTIVVRRFLWLKNGAGKGLMLSTQNNLASGVLCSSQSEVIGTVDLLLAMSNRGIDMGNLLLGDVMLAIVWQHI